MAMEGPHLRPLAASSHSVPLEAIRAGFETGALQVVLLSLAALPDAPSNILTPDETARAERLVAAPVRRGFVAGRWLLRSVLAAVMGVPPGSLELRAGAHGKLFLVGHDAIAPGFNLSHSGDLATVALVRGRQVGIDIEAVRPLTDAALLARRILGPRELQEYEKLADARRATTLLAAWTRKEAVLKAAGTGVSGHLRSIDTWSRATQDGEHTMMVRTEEPATTWSLRTLSMPPGFHGAVAVEGEVPRLAMWQAVPVGG
jgi:4'-phosphopantetheinyl transferase